MLSLIGLSSPIILCVFLDRYLRNDLKAKVTESVYGSIDTPLSDRISLLYESLHRALGRSYTSRIIRLSIISLISILFIYSIQYFLNYKEFTYNISKLEKSIYNNPIFSILVLLSFMAVDVISFAQTLTFMRLTVHCKNVFEVIFLGFADIAISLIIVIVLMPIFIFITHKISTKPRETTYYLSMTSGTQRQDISIYDVIRMTAPWAFKKDQDSEQAFNEDREKYNLGDWYYTNPSISATDSTNTPDLEVAAAGLDYHLGKTLYLTKNINSSDTEANFLKKIMTTHENIERVDIVSSESDVFGNQVILFKIYGRATYSKLNLLYDYTSIMNDINYLGNDLGKFTKLSNKLYSENDLTYMALFNGLENRIGKTMYFACNETNVVEGDHSFLISEDNKECTNGVAMSKNMLEGLASISSYKFSDGAQIPILPTSLSSIFLTAFLYICSLSWIALPYIRRIIHTYAEDGEILVTRHVFTITFSTLIIITSPLIFVYNYYF